MALNTKYRLAWAIAMLIAIASCERDDISRPSVWAKPMTTYDLIGKNFILANYEGAKIIIEGTITDPQVGFKQLILSNQIVPVCVSSNTTHNRRVIVVGIVKRLRIANEDYDETVHGYALGTDFCYLEIESISDAGDSK